MSCSHKSGRLHEPLIYTIPSIVPFGSRKKSILKNKNTISDISNIIDILLLILYNMNTGGICVYIVLVPHNPSPSSNLKSNKKKHESVGILLIIDIIINDFLCDAAHNIRSTLSR